MVNSDKRQRHKDGHRSRMEAAREAEARRRRNRTLLTVGLGLVAVVALFVAITVISDDEDETVDASGSTTLPVDTSDTSDTSAPPATVAMPAPTAGEAIEGDTPCPEADGSSPRTTSFTQEPPMCIDPAKTYTATIETSEGAIEVALDVEQSPKTVNNFVVLSRYHYFDGLPFHRIVTGFVNQTGSSGVPDYGSGGPGYDLTEEAPTKPYEVGTLAMARAEAVSGSQFFFTLDPAPLEGSVYPIIGKVSAGTEVVDVINAFGDGTGEGAPTKLVTIDSITIAEA